MKLNADQPKVPESKPNAKDDLKSLPLPEVEKKLGSPPDGRRASPRPNQAQDRQFFPAGIAPGGPEGEDNGLAAQRLGRKGLAIEGDERVRLTATEKVPGIPELRLGKQISIITRHPREF